MGHLLRMKTKSQKPESHSFDSVLNVPLGLQLSGSLSSVLMQHPILTPLLPNEDK